MAEQLITIEDLSVLTKIKLSSLYKLTAQQAIPAYKIGGRLRFKPSEIEAWLSGYAIVPSKNTPKQQQGGTNE